MQKTDLTSRKNSKTNGCKIHRVTRAIREPVSRELWVLAGGRCQFPSCNRLLYKSPVTQERVNIAQKAHIYSFAKGGPRGRGPFARNASGLNDTANLLLVCHGCHTVIDRDKGGQRYSADLLRAWKQEHEARIVRVTGICADRKSHVVLYGSRIGREDSPLQSSSAIEAMFPDRFPAEDLPISIATKFEHNDNTPDFWTTEAKHLRSTFERRINPLIAENHATHFSVFGLAGIPLLVLLGSLFTDKRDVDTYQLSREPRGWAWRNDSKAGFAFVLKRPRRAGKVPVLVLSLSAVIDSSRVTSVLGRNVSIWELTHAQPHNDFMRSRAQLSQFRSAIRKAMVAINQVHGSRPLHVFPAIPVACAVEFGRARMPKADSPWILYDQNPAQNRFTKTLTIGEQHEHQ